MTFPRVSGVGPMTRLFDTLVLSKSLPLPGSTFSPWLDFPLCWAQKAQGYIWEPGV